MRGGTCFDDLQRCNLLKISKNTYKDNEKLMVRWVVLKEGQDGKCWTNCDLFEAYRKFYENYLAKDAVFDLCYISGAEAPIQKVHPKGVVRKIPGTNGAKLISANDSTGYTYRGRFAEPSEALSISMETSQKAHNALRWLVELQGKSYYSSRTFVMWNSEGKRVPDIDSDSLFSDNGDVELIPQTDYVKYREYISNVLKGYRIEYENGKDRGVQVIALQAATTGRLSITYYTELDGSEYIDKIEKWYANMVWWYFGKLQTPSPMKIIKYAYGVQKGNYVEIDEKLRGDQMQNIMKIILENGKVPFALKNALVQKCSFRQAYDVNQYENLLSVTCAVIKKYESDSNKEVNMELEKDNRDRSYLFGRLLALAEYIEKSASNDKDRETNAVRLQASFAQRPMYTWKNIESALQPYYVRLNPGARNYLKNMTGEIISLIQEGDVAQLNRPLSEFYLIGYYLQRRDFYTKKENKNSEEE